MRSFGNMRELRGRRPESWGAVRAAVTHLRRAIAATVPCRWFVRAPVIPTPRDFRRRTLPVLVWSACVLACLVLSVIRYEFEYHAWDLESARAAAERVSRERTASLESLYGSDDDEDTDLRTAAGPTGPVWEWGPVRPQQELGSVERIDGPWEVKP